MCGSKNVFVLRALTRRSPRLSLDLLIMANCALAPLNILLHNTLKYHLTSEMCTVGRKSRKGFQFASAYIYNQLLRCEVKKTFSSILLEDKRLTYKLVKAFKLRACLLQSVSVALSFAEEIFFLRDF